MILMSCFYGFVSTQYHFLRVFEINFISGNVLWQINKDRALTTGRCYMKSLFDYTGKIIDILYQVVMFSDRECNTCDISFLECIVPDHRSGYLTGKGYNRYRVHVCIGNTGNKICGSRTGCCNTYTYITRSTCISVCCMDCCLFMSYKYVFYLCIEQFIIDG